MPLRQCDYCTPRRLIFTLPFFPSLFLLFHPPSQVRNIPNKYQQQMLLEEINISHEGTYDFFYLPIDFKNKCNVGYCFINFLDPKHIVAFVKEFNGLRWKSFNSEKVCAITFARIQGKGSMVSRFQNSSLLEKDDEYRPLLFYSSGPDRGKPEPFPSSSRSVPVTSQAGPQQQQQQSPGGGGGVKYGASSYNVHGQGQGQTQGQGQALQQSSSSIAAAGGADDSPLGGAGREAEGEEENTTEEEEESSGASPTPSHVHTEEREREAPAPETSKGQGQGLHSAISDEA
jgi:RNA recognition motif 2